MPGNLLFADSMIPKVSGDVTKDIKTLVNHIYMLQEQLRYTMKNLGMDNMNATELIDLSNYVTDELNITVQSLSDDLDSAASSIVTLQGTADTQGAELTLMAGYTGMDSVVTVATAAAWTALSPKVITTTYYITETETYMRYNGSIWVASASPIWDTTAELKIQADANGSSIGMIARSTGNDDVIIVPTWSESGKDTGEVYYAEDTKLYYTYVGSAWISKSSADTTASFVASAINGQSVASINADNIYNDGTVHFIVSDDLGEEGETVIHGSRIDTGTLSANSIIVGDVVLPADIYVEGTTKINGGLIEADSIATDALKVRTQSNLDWLDFYAGIDMTVIDVEDTSYYPDTRQLIGIKAIRFYEDSSLTNGHGDSSNALYQTGQISYGASAIQTPLSSSNGGLIVSTTKQYGTLSLVSSCRVDVIAPDLLTLWSGASGTGCMIAITPSTIIARKYSSGSQVGSDVTII